MEKKDGRTQSNVFGCRFRYAVRVYHNHDQQQSYITELNAFKPQFSS
jgi:hypothetical protein